MFCGVSHRRGFCPYYHHDPNHCLHLKVLQAGYFLLPLSLLKYFSIPEISDSGWRYAPYFVANIIKKEATIGPAPLCFPESKAFLYFIRNCLISFLLLSSGPFDTNMLRICKYCAYTFPIKT